MLSRLRGQYILGNDARLGQFFILFLIWPFLAFLLALKYYHLSVAKKVVFLFLVYYGLTFVMGELGGGGTDSERHAMSLIRTAELPFTDFFKILGGLNSSERTTVDIVSPFVFFVVSRFTNDYHILFAVYAMIFGFFYLKSVNLLHDRFREAPNWNSMILLAFFAMILPITFINGFRMWTAAWIFFYGAYHVIMHRDIRFLWLSIGACLVHFSFMTANLVLLIYLLVGNRNYIYIPLLLVSFVAPYMLKPAIQAISETMGGAIQNRFEGYTSENYGEALQSMAQKASWFVQLYQNLVFYYIIASMLFIKFSLRKLEETKEVKNLFSFLLLFLAFVNFTSVIPSFGRFQLLFYLFGTLYIFLFTIRQGAEKLSFITLAGLFPMILYTAVTLRFGIDSLNAWLVMPGFGVPLFAPAISLSEFLFN